MGSHVFLSPGWIEAAAEIYDRFEPQATPPDIPVRLNITITDAPFDPPVVEGHFDTTAGMKMPLLGHLETVDASASIPHAVARRLILEAEPEDFMIAFMSGEIEVTGDVAALFEIADVNPTEAEAALAEEVAAELRAITV